MAISFGTTSTTGQVVDRVPEPVFYGIIWMGVTLCTSGFALRAYIRIRCFHRLLPEDYLMLLALIILIAFSIMAQINLPAIYFTNHVIRGAIPVNLENINTILSTAGTALRTEAACLVIFVVGVLVIKLNFLVFFYRIGERLKTYLVLWWIGFGIVSACGIVGIGIVPYQCLLGDPYGLVIKCSATKYEKYQSNVNKSSVAIDVISDAVVIAFPIIILWNARISTAQRITLSSVFCLVGLTVAMTIVRGLTYNDTDTTWAMFFFYVEYMVAFLISCIISFRALWGQKTQQIRRHSPQNFMPPPGEHPPTIGGRVKRQIKMWHDTALETFRDLEGTTLERESEDGLPQPESGRLSVDFSQGDAARQWERPGRASTLGRGWVPPGARTQKTLVEEPGPGTWREDLEMGDLRSETIEERREN